MASDNDILGMRLDLLHEDVGEIKTALGKLSDAITKLALVEQSQLQTAEALERAFKAIERVENRLMKLESANVKNSESAKWVDRAAGAIIAGLAAAGLKAFGIF